MIMARPVQGDSWLHEERFDRLRSALLYAQTKTNAIPALSQVEPEEAAHLFLIMLRGWERYGDVPELRGQ